MKLASGQPLSGGSSSPPEAPRGSGKLEYVGENHEVDLDSPQQRISSKKPRPVHGGHAVEINTILSHSDQFDEEVLPKASLQSPASELSRLARQSSSQHRAPSSLASWGKPGPLKPSFQDQDAELKLSAHQEPGGKLVQAVEQSGGSLKDSTDFSRLAPPSMESGAGGIGKGTKMKGTIYSDLSLSDDDDDAQG